MIRGLAALTAVVGGLAAAPAATAAVQDPLPIGPNQSFVGLVNGDQSNATIKMACAGPVQPGELGHPWPNQYTEVELSPLGQVAGFTGQARSIRATLIAPVPATTPPPILATFDSYYVQIPISTSLLLPCGGPGKIDFAPVLGGPLARSWDVNVTFVGLP
jgi:hypothetical protein